MDDWASKIRALEASGRSLTDLGREIGLSPQALSDIKQGRSTAPRGMAAVRLHSLYMSLPAPAEAPKAA